VEFVKTLLTQQPMIALFLTIAIGYSETVAKKATASANSQSTPGRCLRVKQKPSVHTR